MERFLVERPLRSLDSLKILASTFEMPDNAIDLVLDGQDLDVIRWLTTFLRLDRDLQTHLDVICKSGDVYMFNQLVRRNKNQVRNNFGFSHLLTSIRSKNPVFLDQVLTFFFRYRKMDRHPERRILAETAIATNHRGIIHIMWGRGCIRDMDIILSIPDSVFNWMTVNSYGFFDYIVEYWSSTDVKDFVKVLRTLNPDLIGKVLLRYRELGVTSMVVESVRRLE